MASKLKLAWNSDFTEQLIDLYRSEKILWKKSLPGHNKKEERIRCLERISAKLEDIFSGIHNNCVSFVLFKSEHMSIAINSTWVRS